MSETTTKADELFDAIRTSVIAASKMFDELLTVCGIDPNNPDVWPLEDATYDDCDYSFEFKDVKVGWKPTESQLATCWALGFHRCWICYTDGTEAYFVKPEPLASERRGE